MSVILTYLQEAGMTKLCCSWSYRRDDVYLFSLCASHLETFYFVSNPGKVQSVCVCAVDCRIQCEKFVIRYTLARYGYKFVSNSNLNAYLFLQV